MGSFLYSGSFLLFSCLQISPLSSFSLMKCLTTKICLVRSCWIGLCAIPIAVSFIGPSNLIWLVQSCWTALCDVLFIYLCEFQIVLFQKKLNGITSGFSQFSKGIPIYAISQVLDKIISGANGPHLLINGVKRPMPQVRILEVEFTPRLLSMARCLGLSDFRIKVWIYSFLFYFMMLCVQRNFLDFVFPDSRTRFKPFCCFEELALTLQLS
jgi:hypothetical protein